MDFKGKSVLQFIKFAIVGLSNTLVDWVVYFVLIKTLLPNDIYAAKSISFAVSVLNSFVFNSIWTFRKEFLEGIREKSLRFYALTKYFLRFFVVSLVGFGINYYAFKYSNNGLKNSLDGTILSLVTLCIASGAAIIWNFFINKIWTYKKLISDDLDSEDKVKLVRNFKFDVAAVLLLIVMFFISFSVMKGDSGIVDEIAHIPAGYTYDEYHDYRMNPEHPPLAKALSGIPLMFLNLNSPTADSSWNSISQWDSGWAFLYTLGNDADTILFWARIPMILLSLMLGLLLYKWAAEKLGHKVALAITAIYAFTPEILGHGHYVTTDVAAALGFALAIYTFDKYLSNRTKKNLIIAGIGFGIAQLLKFSCFLLLPIFVLYIIVKALYERKEQAKKFWAIFWDYFKSYIWIVVIALIVVWLVYIPLVWKTPVQVEKQVILNNLSSDSRTLILRNFLDALFGNVVTRAIGHYLLGVMLVFGRVAGGNSTFIIGHFSDKSISWFFPVAYLIKTPLTVLFLLFSGIVYTFVKKGKSKSEVWFLWLMFVPVAVYWAVTMKGSLNIGTRHLLPTLPFVYLFIGWAIKDFITGKKIIYKVVIAVLILFMICSTALSYPNYLAYFNETVAGTPGYKLMVDSSLDWGQDLKRLKIYADENHIDYKDMKIDYFGGGKISYYLPGSTAWRSGYGPTTGYIAISATFYQMSKLQSKAENKWSYDWLEDYTPTVVGSSILVFHISPEDLVKNPPVSPYPIYKFDEMPAKSTTQL